MKRLEICVLCEREFEIDEVSPIIEESEFISYACKYCLTDRDLYLKEKAVAVVTILKGEEFQSKCTCGPDSFIRCDRCFTVNYVLDVLQHAADYDVNRIKRRLRRNR